MEKNRKQIPTIEYICVTLVAISFILGAAWVMSPQEFTLKFEIDNNTKEAVKSIFSVMVFVLAYLVYCKIKYGRFFEEEDAKSEQSEVKDGN